VARTAVVWALIVITFAVAGCAVGPNFKPPAPPATQGYAADLPPATVAATDSRGGEAQKFRFDEQLPTSWWQLFGCAKLNALIVAARAKNPTLQAAEATLRVAEQNLRAGQGALLPSVQATGVGTRQALPGATYTLLNASLNVSYLLDLFGGTRRSIEGLAAAVDYAQFQQEGAQLALTANVVTTAIQLAAVSEQIAAANEIIATEQRALGLAQDQFDVGSAARADVLSAKSEVEATQATLPGLEQQLVASQNLLAILTGQYPHDAQPLRLTLADFTLPQDLPVTLPSHLVRQRPDVRAQEALLHQASAQIGVATANLLPQVTLAASDGGETAKPAYLLVGTGQIWSIGASIAQPLFEGGRLMAQHRAALAAYDEAAATYGATVLEAFNDVAGALSLLGNDALALAARYTAMNDAKDGLELTETQYAVGSIAYTTLLLRQQQFQRARIGYVQALARRYTDTVTLFAALGGGWQ
jgi:NodT family efflux transporter outer membrane factor (OMF) lipoprotein